MQGSVEECGAVRVVCGQERLGDEGALPLRKGVGGYGGFSRGVRTLDCEGRLLVWGHAEPGPAPTVQLPPGPSCCCCFFFLAPGGLFEARSTRGCAEAGC